MTMKWWGWGSIDKEASLAQTPKLQQFMLKNLACDVAAVEKHVTLEQVHLTPVVENKAFMAAISEQIKDSQIVSDHLQRVSHAYGKSFRDLFRIRRGEISRAPDYIIYPEHHEQILFLLQKAALHNVVIIPFGGGTNIVGAVEAKAHEARTVVSLDMKRMIQLLSIDKISMTATFQAGILGPDIEKQLNAQGFSLGHYPDSFEFSTLGGWLATRSAGMQSDQYGTISQMLLSMRVATLQGTIQTQAFAHAAMGPNINEIIMGSDGILGIITEATMKIHPMPVQQEFRGLIFPDFAKGTYAIQTALRAGCLPHLMRLMTPRETQLGFHLKPESTGIRAHIEKCVRWYLTQVKKIHFENSSLMIIGFDGSSAQIEEKRRQVLRICAQWGGVDLGTQPGNSWFKRKYDYPYLRDLVMDHGNVVDVAETITPWKNVLPLYDAVEKAAYSAMFDCISAKTRQALNNHFPGYLGCHTSHNYHSGACLYFTFAFYAPEQTLLKYQQVKAAITDAIVQNGGALSHHHSVGYEHSPWLPKQISPAAMDTLIAIKDHLDPSGILNPGKLLPDADFKKMWDVIE